MADRIEYQGVPLPSGLPGFGGGTVEVLTLPGFNTVVAPLKFGPVVDAINAVPPDPTPPIGSNPDDPTDQIIDPGPPPVNVGPGSDSRMTSLCANYDCESDDDLGTPLVFAQKLLDPICVACDKIPPGGGKYYPNFFTATSEEFGVYYKNGDWIQGKADGQTWDIKQEEFKTTNSNAEFKIGENEFSDGAKLNKDKVILSGTEYRKNAKIFDIDNGRLYEPKSLEVCVGGQTKTWYVLAYEQ